MTLYKARYVYVKLKSGDDENQHDCYVIAFHGYLAVRIERYTFFYSQ